MAEDWVSTTPYEAAITVYWAFVLVAALAYATNKFTFVETAAALAVVIQYYYIYQTARKSFDDTA